MLNHGYNAVHQEHRHVTGDGIIEVITEGKSFESAVRAISSLEAGEPRARLSWRCGV
jgi:hypothetical protein